MSDDATVILAHYDNEVITELRRELEVEGFRVQSTTSGRDALGRAARPDIDALVLDILLPKMNGLNVLKTLREDVANRDLPVLVLIDEGDTYSENRALICGADGIVKRGPDGKLPEGALGAKLRSVLTEKSLGGGTRNQEEDLLDMLERAGEHLEAENPVLAHITDPLTGLVNGAFLELKLSEEYKRSRRFGLPLSYVAIQLVVSDRSEIKESESDWRRILNEFAGMLLCESRDIDVLARTGADTFVLLLPHTPLAGAKVMTERVLENARQRKLTFGENGAAVTAHAGLALCEGEGLASADELPDRAEEALKTAISGNRGDLVIWAQKATRG